MYSNYLNSDATWHTLLTIKAYDETPASVHKFLPIVSLGGDKDKRIPWGATIPDKYGNYYYTSFSPAGFIAPYLFFKIFHLPIAEGSLYIFNSFLFFVSAVIFMNLIFEMYGGKKHKSLVVITGIIAYLFSPELLHGMGKVYWHQSLMQVTLISQIYSYYKYNKSKFMRAVFWILCILNPYIEWTGYVANVGFALTIFSNNFKEHKKERIFFASKIAISTILSFALFAVHYMSVVDSRMFFGALKSRFFARSFSHIGLFLSLIYGYLKSFKVIWAVITVLLLIILTFIVAKRKNILSESVLWRNKCLFFVMCFPVLENGIMLEHSVSYSYDRMKLIFPLSVIICDLCNIIFAHLHRKMLNNLIAAAILSAMIGNLGLYKMDNYYQWDVDYRLSNITFADYLENNYPDSVYGIKDRPVRGYVNLLFNRGIYERLTSVDEIIEYAEDKNARHAILLISTYNPDAKWNMYEFESAVIYDTNLGTYSQAKIIDGKCKQSSLPEFE